MNMYDVNKEKWEKGYFAPNVESITYRLFGRILKPDFNLPKEDTKLLDFGCGMGAAVNYFNSVGFTTKGIDISEKDINKGKEYFPDIKNSLEVVPTNPRDVDYYGWKDGIDVVYACQSLYYFTKNDFYYVLNKLYDSMPVGGLFFATFKTPKQWNYYNCSTPTDDPWIRKVSLNTERLNFDIYQFFVEDEEDMVSRLSLFKPLHVGYYTMQLRNDESDGLHLSFLGIKE